jgi:signal transduction histidine kinase
MTIGSTEVQSTAETERCDDILVVDDTPGNLVAFKAVLDQLGVRVVTANSGLAALRLLSKGHFALLLLDVNMPTMDGLELARRVRDGELAKSTPIIFITANTHENTEILAAYELGAVDFLTKPILPEVLTAKANVFINLARQAELIKEQARREHARALEMERNSWHEQSLQREKERLEEMHRHKDWFLAVLGHELRNPLTPLVASLAVLREKAERDPAIARTRDIMEKQLEHLTRLADDLVDVARINAGKIELRKEAVAIQEVVAQAVATSRPLIEERDHVLELELPAEPVVLYADRVRLVQVITNLLNNAARYTPSKGNITIHCARNGDELELRVEDSGQGIARKLLPHVFESFVQGEERRTHGLGLGLAVVHRLVTLHGGSVSAESDGEGHGSKFTVRLPLIPGSG